MKIQCEWVYGFTRCSGVATNFWWRPNNEDYHVAGCKQCSDMSMRTTKMKNHGWIEVSREDYIVYKILSS